MNTVPDTGQRPMNAIKICANKREHKEEAHSSGQEEERRRVSELAKHGQIVIINIPGSVSVHLKHEGPTV
jgi:hypothetical protein